MSSRLLSNTTMVKKLLFSVHRFLGCFLDPTFEKFNWCKYRETICSVVFQSDRFLVTRACTATGSFLPSCCLRSLNVRHPEDLCLCFRLGWFSSARSNRFLELCLIKWLRSSSSNVQESCLVAIWVGHRWWDARTLCSPCCYGICML